MTGLDHTDFKQAGSLLDQLKHVRALRSLMKFNTDTHEITAVTVFVLSHDDSLMDISTDVEGSPFKVDEFLTFCNRMLDEKEQKLIGDLKALGVNVGPHTPAPAAPPVENTKESEIIARVENAA